MALRTLDGSLVVAIIGFQGEGPTANPSPKGTLLLPLVGDIFIALQHRVPYYPVGSRHNAVELGLGSPASLLAEAHYPNTRLLGGYLN